MKEWTIEESRRAAEQLYERAWADEEPEYRPKKANWVTNTLRNLVTPLTTRRILDMQCELNEAAEIIKEYGELLRYRFNDCEPRVNEWLSRNTVLDPSVPSKGNGPEVEEVISAQS